VLGSSGVETDLAFSLSADTGALVIHRQEAVSLSLADEFEDELEKSENAHGA